MNDELIFLGSGGGRHNIRTQHRATGGILYKFKGNIRLHFGRRLIWLWEPGSLSIKGAAVSLFQHLCLVP